MASASTMMPMPPNQCSAQRHRLIAGGSESTPVRTVDPVVVRPEVVSKYASVKLKFGIASSSGIVAAPAINTHASVTSRKPSRDLSSRLKRRVLAQIRRPVPLLRSPASTKSHHVPSW